MSEQSAAVICVAPGVEHEPVTIAAQRAAQGFVCASLQTVQPVSAHSTLRLLPTCAGIVFRHMMDASAAAAPIRLFGHGTLLCSPLLPPSISPLRAARLVRCLVLRRTPLPRRKKCNSFSDAAVYFLTGHRLDRKYRQLEAFAQAADRYMLVRAVTGGMYMPNPKADKFDIEMVVQGLAYTGLPQLPLLKLPPDSLQTILAASC